MISRRWYLYDSHYVVFKSALIPTNIKIVIYFQYASGGRNQTCFTHPLLFELAYTAKGLTGYCYNEF